MNRRYEQYPKSRLPPPRTRYEERPFDRDKRYRLDERSSRQDGRYFESYHRPRRESRNYTKPEEKVIKPVKEQEKEPDTSSQKEKVSKQQDPAIQTEERFMRADWGNESDDDSVVVDTCHQTENKEKQEWVMHLTEEGEKYYYNKATQQSVWEVPPSAIPTEKNEPTIEVDYGEGEEHVAATAAAVAVAAEVVVEEEPVQKEDTIKQTKEIKSSDVDAKSSDKTRDRVNNRDTLRKPVHYSPYKRHSDGYRERGFHPTRPRHLSPYRPMYPPMDPYRPRPRSPPRGHYPYVHERKNFRPSLPPPPPPPSHYSRAPPLSPSGRSYNRYHPRPVYGSLPPPPPPPPSSSSWHHQRERPQFDRRYSNRYDKQYR